MGFVRTLVIIIVLYMVLKLLARFILPWFVKLSLKRFQKRFYEQNPHLRQEKTDKEGEVTITRIKKEKPEGVPDDLGDYVDYEEVK